MSGTDPKGKWFRKGDPTTPYQPDGADANPPAGEQPAGLPKVPGITLHQEIARGGMGVVYSGRQDFLDRRVAVKFLSVELGGASFAQRFQREAKILAGIKHPNIVACHMADTTEDGQSYLVMEFIAGPNLKSFIEDNGPATPMASLKLIRATAQALHHAHQSEIIHRDVKPENILLEQVTSSSLDINFPFVPKLVDLGLARMTHESAGMGLTSPGSVMGTPSTMSPEQFDDPDSVDFRSDIYGLGCCLYEMLVGSPAFRGNKLTDIVTRKREAVGPNPCDENANVPAAVGALCQQMLASNREDRQSSYKELDKQVEELMKEIVLSRNSARTDTIVDMSAEDAGATMVSAPRPGPAPTADAGAAGKAPGLLNTGELDFLSADGGGAGGGDPPAPAFQDPGTQLPKPGGAAAPQPNKRGLYIGIGAAAVVALLVGVWMGMDGNDPVTGGNGNGNGNGNAASRALSVELAGPQKVEIKEPFTLTAAASESAGDALTYRWSAPDGVMMMREQGKASMSLLLQDGLPGLTFSVSVAVEDGSGGEPVVARHLFEVADYPVVLPLSTRKVQGDWQTQGMWIDVSDVEPGVAARARREPAVLSTPVGDDDYWEFFGTVQPTDMGRGLSEAVVGVTFGDAGYAVRATLRGEYDRGVEVVERAGADGWRALVDAVDRRWVQPADTIDDNRAWYSIRRESSRLVLTIGEYLQPPAKRGQDLPDPIKKTEESVVFELSTAEGALLAKEGRLTLRVNKGRALFRLKQR